MQDSKLCEKLNELNLLMDHRYAMDFDAALRLTNDAAILAPKDASLGIALAAAKRHIVACQRAKSLTEELGQSGSVDATEMVLTHAGWKASYLPYNQEHCDPGPNEIRFLSEGEDPQL